MFLSDSARLSQYYSCYGFEGDYWPARRNVFYFGLNERVPVFSYEPKPEAYPIYHAYRRDPTLLALFMASHSH